MSTVSTPFWIVFNLIVVLMLYLDIKVIHKKAHAVSLKEATFWSIFWVAVSLIFNVGIYYYMGKEKAIQFLTGYVIEKSLSVDNLFVFLLIFSFFGVPPKYQPRVLHWGIVGAVIMRFVLIFTGAALIQKFHWIIYLFGALLVYTGIKMAFEKERKLEPEKNLAIRLFKKVMPTAMREFVDEKFFIRINGVLHATPLFVVLLLIESSDLIFAVDSIPAIFAITTDTFIVYTSNIFAILGLRALYFVLSSIIPLFAYLKYGISIVLSFVGVKMLVSGYYSIPTTISLIVVLGLISLSIILSVLIKKKELLDKNLPS